MICINNVSLFLDENKVLDGINLKLEGGGIYGLIGPNGVGKTSLIKCLVGIYKVDEGEILYDSKNVYDNVEVKKNIAYVSDDSYFITSFKVKDLLKYYKLAYENFDEEKFNKLNSFFNIPIDKKIISLSKGMKMRISIMIGLSLKTDYLILDEPTIGLDPVLKNKLLKILHKEAIENNKVIIISSHHLSELEKICDEVILIKNGKVDYKNSLKEMKNRIKKIQVAFDAPVYEEDINIKGIYKLWKVGRVFTIITDNFNEDFIKEINKLEPLFVEEIELSLEDIFVLRIGGEGENEEYI